MASKREKENPLEFFCKQNAEQIVSCQWIYSDRCMKSCKYYREQTKKENKQDYDELGVGGMK